jgi:hypothetical protein
MLAGHLMARQEKATLR